MTAKTVDPQSNTFCRIVAALLIESARATSATHAPKRKRKPNGNGRRNRE